MELIKPANQKVWGWPAAANFILGGMASGFYLMALLIGSLERAAPFPHPTFFKLAAPTLACLGFLALGLEAGRPWRARHLLRNLGGSWMSIETLTGAVFVLAALGDLFFPSSLLRGLAVLGALGFLTSQSLLLYFSSGVTAWNVPLVPLVIAASGFTAGSGLLLLSSPAAVAGGRALAVLGLAWATVNLTLWLLYLYRTDAEEFHQATLPLRRPKALITIAGFGHFLPLLLLGLLAASPTGNGEPRTLLWSLAGLTLVAGASAQKAGLILKAGKLRGLGFASRAGAKQEFAYRVPAPTFGPLKKGWTRFWMRFAGLSPGGRLATRLAVWFAPPHKSQVVLAKMNSRGFVAPTATIHHPALILGAHIYIGDRVMIFERKNGGPMELGKRVCIYRDAILETGHGGSLKIGPHSNIHPRCQLNAYVAPIEIGSRVGLAPNCALYSYNHRFAPGNLIHDQGLESKGPIVIDDDAWLGFGVIVLSGVHIGKGAVIGAGSVVTRDIPAGAIASGVPARVVKMRTDLAGMGTSPAQQHGPEKEGLAVAVEKEG